MSQPGFKKFSPNQIRGHTLSEIVIATRPLQVLALGHKYWPALVSTSPLKSIFDLYPQEHSFSTLLSREDWKFCPRVAHSKKLHRRMAIFPSLHKKGQIKIDTSVVIDFVCNHVIFIQSRLQAQIFAQLCLHARKRPIKPSRPKKVSRSSRTFIISRWMVAQKFLYSFLDMFLTEFSASEPCVMLVMEIQWKNSYKF